MERMCQQKDEADAKMLVFSQPVLLSVCNTGRIWQMISRVKDMSKFSSITPEGRSRF